MALSWLPKQANPIDTLFQGFPDNLIQNMMERKKLAQQEKQHQEEMELRRQAAARAGANSDLQRKLLMEHLLSAQHANDPMYGYNTMMAIQNKMAEDEAAQGGQPTGGQQQYPDLEKMFKGQGMFNLPPQEQEAGNMPAMPGQDEQMVNQMPSQPQQPTQPTQPHHGGLNLDLMRKNPAFHALAKGILKYDPLAVIPEQPEEQRRNEEKSAAIKAQNASDIKKKEALQEEIPEAEKLITDIEDARKILKNYPQLFGPGVGGLNFLGGPSQRKRNLKTKEEREAWGKIEDLFGTLVGKKATEYSHKGLKVAFDLAGVTKPSFEEYPETIDAKLAKMENALKSGNARDLEWYKSHGGNYKSTLKSNRLKFNPVTGRLE